jgi:hypothetical protein
MKQCGSAFWFAARCLVSVGNRWVIRGRLSGTSIRAEDFGRYSRFQNQLKETDESCAN